MDKQNEIVQTTPYSLIEMAIEKDADIDKLQKLMDMQIVWEKKEAAKSFKMAITDFQANKPELIKDKKVEFNGKLQYKYIPLSTIQKLIDPILSKHGISYRWEQTEIEERISLTCIISHVNGHEERTTLSAPLDGSGSKNKIQSIGSTVSYLKRYTLEGALGLSSDVDNDGGKPKTKAEKEDLSPAHPKWHSAEDALSKGSTTIEDIKRKYNLSAKHEKMLR